jgi:hypothetical protein
MIDDGSARQLDGTALPKAGDQAAHRCPRMPSPDPQRELLSLARPYERRPITRTRVHVDGLPLGPADNHIDMAAPEFGADEPLAPIGDGRFGAAPQSLIGGIRVRLILPGLAPHD